MSEFWSKLSAAERKAMKTEMLQMVMAGMIQSNPGMTKGAIRVKASKFVDAAILREAASGKTNISSTHSDSVQ